MYQMDFLEFSVSVGLIHQKKLCIKKNKTFLLRKHYFFFLRGKEALFRNYIFVVL